MRRNRLRSFTIDAENEEEYIKEYEKIKSRLSQMNFNKNQIQGKINEDDEDDLCYKKHKSDFNLNDSNEDNYSDLGANNNEDEDNLIYENDEILKHGEEAITKKENSEEQGIEILVNFLKSDVDKIFLKSLNIFIFSLIRKFFLCTIPASFVSCITIDG